MPLFRPGTISNSQPTRCGHTLRGVHCRGLASGCAPSNPAKTKAMKTKTETRTALVKLRVTPAEKDAITAKAEAQGQTVTDFIRQRALDYRLRQTPLEKEHVRQLARIGVNLNQLARWVNIHKNRAEAIDVLTALVSLERELKNPDTPPPLAPPSAPPPADREPPCI